MLVLFYAGFILCWFYFILVSFYTGLNSEQNIKCSAMVQTKKGKEAVTELVKLEFVVHCYQRYEKQVLQVEKQVLQQEKQAL